MIVPTSILCMHYVHKVTCYDHMFFIRELLSTIRFSTMGEKPPTYAKVRDKMREEDWDYIGRIHKEFSRAIYVSDNDSHTLLGVAINEQCISAIRYLLANGAVVQETSTPWDDPPVCCRAIRCGDTGPELLDILAENGNFDPRFTYVTYYDISPFIVKAVEGLTPLHYLAKRCSCDTFEPVRKAIVWFVDHGVPLNARTSDGLTARNYLASVIEDFKGHLDKYDVLDSLLSSRPSKNAYST